MVLLYFKYNEIESITEIHYNMIFIDHEVLSVIVYLQRRTKEFGYST